MIDKQRFWDKVLVSRFNDGSCWEWQGATRDGYGVFWQDNRSVPAHRTSWEVSYGEIPTGLQVLHTCDNRLCVKPEHLFLGTQKDNIQDAIAKGRYNPVAYGKMTGKVRNSMGQFIKH